MPDRHLPPAASGGTSHSSLWAQIGRDIFPASETSIKSGYILPLALALAACSGADNNAPTETTTVASEPTMPESEAAPMAGTPATPVDAASYITKAGAGDLWEIESSKALLAKSTNAGVKAFAQMMITTENRLPGSRPPPAKPR